MTGSTRGWWNHAHHCRRWSTLLQWSPRMWSGSECSDPHHVLYLEGNSAKTQIMYVHTYAYTYSCTYTYTYVFMYVHSHIYMYVCTYTCTYSCTQVSSTVSITQVHKYRYVHEDEPLCYNHSLTQIHVLITGASSTQRLLIHCSIALHKYTICMHTYIHRHVDGIQTHRPSTHVSRDH